MEDPKSKVLAYGKTTVADKFFGNMEDLLNKGLAWQDKFFGNMEDLLNKGLAWQDDGTREALRKYGG